MMFSNEEYKLQILKITDINEYNNYINKIYEDEYNKREIEHKNEYEYKQAIFEYKRYEYNKACAEDTACALVRNKPISELSAEDYSNTIKTKYPELHIIHTKNIIKIIKDSYEPKYIKLTFSEVIGRLCIFEYEDECIPIANEYICFASSISDDICFASSISDDICFASSISDDICFASSIRDDILYTHLQMCLDTV